MDSKVYDEIMALPLGERGPRKLDQLKVPYQRAIWIALAMRHVSVDPIPLVGDEEETFDTIARLHGNVAVEAMRPLMALGVQHLRDRVDARLIEQGRERVEAVWVAAMTLVAEAILPADDEYMPGDWYDNCWSAARRLTDAASYDFHNLETWVQSAAEIVLRHGAVQEALDYEAGMERAVNGTRTQLQEERG